MSYLPTPLYEDDACLHVGNLRKARRIEVEVVARAFAVVVVRAARDVKKSASHKRILATAKTRAFFRSSNPFLNTRGER